MKVYISGKITGLERAVYSANFEKKEKELLRSGYQVFNPVKEAQKLEQRIAITFQRKPTYEEYMDFSIRGLLDCDGICQLNDWKESNGAKCEYQVATSCGKIFVKTKILRRGIHG